jgi:hypothetical protein
MSSEVRRQLGDIYQEDINKLEKLLNRDLSSWLNYAPAK